MTFPNDFWLHLKIRPLSDAAFRAFVEMNGYSRMQNLDGRISVAFARTQWKAKALAELERNHSSRPTLTVEHDEVEGDVYVIRNYGEHQQTRADIEAQSATNSANGRKGGRPPKAKRNETEPVYEPEPNSKQSQSQSQSQESEIDLDDVTHLPESSPVGDVAGQPTDVSEIVLAMAKRAGVKNFSAVRGHLLQVVSPLSPKATVELVEAITARAKGPVRNVDAYIATACRTNADDVRWDYDRLDLGAVA